eukprot:1365245-Amphidinium_carterae.1
MHSDKVQKFKVECLNAERRHRSARGEPMTHARTIRFTGDVRTYSKLSYRVMGTSHYRDQFLFKSRVCSFG